jgi:hypothetical protein
MVAGRSDRWHVPLDEEEQVSLARRMSLLSVGVSLLLGLPALATAQTSREDPQDPALIAEGEAYSVTVDNRGFRDVIVYSVRGGVPIRLGLANSRRISKLRATCGRFLNRTNDFLLRSIAGESVELRGEPIARCDQVIKIVIYPIGLDFSTVWVW